MTVAFDDVTAKIAELLSCRPDGMAPDTALRSLVVDSFALVELAIGLQEDFDVIFTQEDLKPVNTVGDLFELVKSKS